MSRAAAQAWIDRWDRQQENYLPDREDRFTALIDAVEAGAGRSDPVVLDLGCGPGSLSVRLLDRIPAATVIAVDTDPVLLALGRAAHAGRPGLSFADLDLGARGWPASLGLAGQADAAVSTTALHWLHAPDLAAMYAELAAVLRPGGLLLNGDHLKVDPATSPTLARLDRALLEREERRRFPDGHGESWEGWWQAAAAAITRTMALRPGCSAPTWRRCGQPVSPRSGRSGSAARTACSARSSRPNPFRGPGARGPFRLCRRPQNHHVLAGGTRHDPPPGDQ